MRASPSLSTPVQNDDDVQLTASIAWVSIAVVSAQLLALQLPPVYFHASSLPSIASQNVVLEHETATSPDEPSLIELLQLPVYSNSLSALSTATQKVAVTQETPVSVFEPSMSFALDHDPL